MKSSARASLLYYITDRMQLGKDETARRELLLELIGSAARAGIDYIQLRERDLPARELEALANAARRRVAGSHTRLLVNSRIDIAIASGLDGVHLRSGTDEMSPGDTRALFEKAGVKNAVIGVSCHTAAEVARAAARGADFVVFGPVFGKGPDAAGERVQPTGLDALRAACGASSGVPVLAIGAVTQDNARDCLAAGAAGIAGIRLFQNAAQADLARLRALIS